ncbi:MAG: hypothetical protein MJZ30_11480 [Paludibacteraceae bacterium]|nr:hypothetical protein [Paludibacteraceae bacterium]
MELHETEEYKGYTINIYYDECAENPFANWDMLGILYQNRRSASMCGKYLQLLKDFDDGNGNVDWNRLERDYIWLRVYCYEHGGICLSCGREGNPFSDPWDSGLYGIIARRKDEIRDEYGWKRITKERKEKILGYFESEIKVLSDYYEGNVFGYTITDPDGEETDDSCWGFYGSDHEESGLLDQARCAIDYMIRSSDAA